MASVTGAEKSSKQRVPAAERRDALIDAAIEEFAAGGLHGTPVDRIARRVGVAQPYVFSLFATKRDLFVAAVERCFEAVSELFAQTAYEAIEANPGIDVENCEDNPVLTAIGARYVELLGSDRNVLMMQLHAYAACDEPVIRKQVHSSYQALTQRIKELSGSDDAQIQEFMAFGIYLTIQAAMGVGDLAAIKDQRQATLQARHSPE